MGIPDVHLGGDWDRLAHVTVFTIAVSRCNVLRRNV
jgi:hypothetical protein